MHGINTEHQVATASDKSDTELARLVWEYLRLEQPLEKVDVIIGLGSHDLRTAEHCADLYMKGIAPRIIFCGGRGRLTEDLLGNEADRYAEVAMKLGVPESAIIIENTSTNTGENITHAYEMLKERNLLPQRLVIVTKPYMLRRAYATFLKQWPDESMPEVRYSAIDSSMEEYVDGLEDVSQTINIMIGDLQRIKVYPARGFQVEQHIPNEVWQAYEELVQRGYTKHLLEQ